MRTFLLICTVLLLAIATVHGKIYKWTDSNGKVHFTDNISTIPPAYRDQAQGRASMSPSPKRLSEAPTTPPSPASYRVPLYGSSNSLLVDVIFHGSFKARLLVDTGASYTVISPELARQLRLDPDDADIMQIITANGVIYVPLTKVDSITVGDATVHDVDVIVYNTGMEDGLLGLSFLNNFHFALDTRKKEMILTTPTEAQGVKIYGGRPEHWWRYQFRFYRDEITWSKSYLKKHPSPKGERVLRFLEKKLADLERKASHASVPRHWRY